MHGMEWNTNSNPNHLVPCRGTNGMHSCTKQQDGEMSNLNPSKIIYTNPLKNGNVKPSPDTLDLDL